MFVNNLNPVIFSIGPVSIRWYGLAYVIGFLIVLIYGRNKVEKQNLLSKDEFTEFLVYIMLGALVMARLFHVFVYNFNYYVQHPWQIPAVWLGGMSFHGGLVGAVLVALVYCYYKKISFYKLADIIIVPLALALSVGRIANFINGELVGRVTNVPWCVVFKNYTGCRHPVQIYESLKNLFIFFVLFRLSNKKNLVPGFLFWSFIVLYGILRFLAEFIRDNGDVVLSTAQYLCIIMIVLGGFMLYYITSKSS